MKFNSSTIKISLPASKSIANRWLILDFLFPEKFTFDDLGTADDTQELTKAIDKIKHTNSSEEFAIINAGSGGTGFRFLMALLSSFKNHCFLTGTEQILSRPQQQLVGMLNELGADIKKGVIDERNGFFISGKGWNQNEITIHETISSQFISAIALVAAKQDRVFTINYAEKIPSLPYLNITVHCLMEAGIRTSHTQGKLIIYPQKEINPKPISIEKDWSSAAFFYSLLSKQRKINILLESLKLSSMQADSAVQRIAQQLGIESVQQSNGVLIAAVQNFTFPSRLAINFHDYPDLFPALFTACLINGIELYASGIENLIYKESNRIQAMEQIARQLGATMENKSDGLILYPKAVGFSMPSELLIETYNDHRIAICGAIIANCYPEIKVTLDHPDCVSKSFPEFFTELQKLWV